MAIDIKDQPRESFFDYDITDDGVEPENVPYVPRRRGVGPAEITSFLVVVLCVYLLVHWLALTIAGMIA